MIVLEVELNGRRIARAGAKDMGVLGAHVTGRGKLGPTADMNGRDLDLWIGGLTSRKRRPDEHLRWGGRPQLKVGDEVVVRVCEASTADRPKQRSPAKGDTKRPSDRERYEFAKTVYFALRKKFERRRLTARRRPTRARAARAARRER